MYEDAFEKNGFIKIKDKNKMLSIRIDNKNYDFIFETNTINSIPNTDIEFAVAVDSDGNNYFFINKDFNPLHDDTITSPYRTFYDGLMKEPFKHVYPLDTPIRIETDSNIILEIRITRNTLGYLYKFSNELKDIYKTKEELIEQEKIKHYDYLKKEYPKTEEEEAEELKELEELLRQGKITRFDYLKRKPFHTIKKEDVYIYLENLSKCSSWEEIEKVYNKRPLNMEIR